MSDERLKIAVFIDFDNIEIGVKTTLGGHFEVGAVLEAMKERGEVVTKVAYGDWTRATDYGRSMSQHAIHMVQRNLTPGGDKNGADINLALDALEMAFTHSHINAFVIVGGDSDFITLVEKLKQYDRKVFVVGGRSFTSQVMQKNCTEFVAYEDILGITGRARQPGLRTRAVTDIAAAMPLIRRAIKLLADREVTPQLGLLKSTLLQLDSSFSERAYGASSFRDFVEKLAKAGHVILKGTDRSFHVELRETSEPSAATSAGAPAPAADSRDDHDSRPPREPREPREPRAPREPREPRALRDRVEVAATEVVSGEPVSDAGTAATDPAVPAPLEDDAALALMHEGVARLGPVDGYRIMVQAFSREDANPRFPMYVRQFKQFVKGFDESFDERRYGFAGIVDALRFGQREGLFRLERDRQGVVRVHPGAQYIKVTKTADSAGQVGADASAADDAQTGSALAFDAGSSHVEGESTPPRAAATLPADTPIDAGARPPVDAGGVLAGEPAPATVAVAAGAADDAAAGTDAPAKGARKASGARKGVRARKPASTAAAGGAKKKTARPRAKKA